MQGRLIGAGEPQPVVLMGAPTAQLFGPLIGFSLRFVEPLGVGQGLARHLQATEQRERSQGRAWIRA